MSSVDESVIRRNWEVLKQELDVDDFVRKLVSAGVWCSTQRTAIYGNASRDARAEGFLNEVIKSGAKCIQTVCNILAENRTNPRYEALVKALGIRQSTTPDSGNVPRVISARTHLLHHYCKRVMLYKHPCMYMCNF